MARRRRRTRRRRGWRGGGGEVGEEEATSGTVEEGCERRAAKQELWRATWRRVGGTAPSPSLSLSSVWNDGEGRETPS